MGYNKLKAPILTPDVKNAIAIHGAKIAHFRYRFSVDGGAVGEIIPKNSPTIPKNAIMLGGIVNVTTAITSGGAATIALGTHAGSTTSSLKAATGKASFSLAAMLDLIPIWTAATAVKMSANGQLSMTVATAALTAGEFEAFVFYAPADK